MGRFAIRLPFARSQASRTTPEAPSSGPRAEIGAGPDGSGEEPDLHAMARGLADGDACPPALLEALARKIAIRRRKTDTLEGPPSPPTSGLMVRREGLGEWWTEGENLLLAGPGAKIPELRPNPYLGSARRAVVVLGADCAFEHFNLGKEGNLVVIGDKVIANAGVVSCTGPSTVLIGEDTTATFMAMLDCRNGGIIVTGADGMWAHGVSLSTDDTHAIRDAATGERINVFGGRITVDRHVWLGEQTRVLGGARIGAHTVVGMASMVKNKVLEPNSVYAGRPVRLVRSGVTWSREDAP